MSFVLNTGASIPAVGLGTWKSKAGEVGAAVRSALQAGYRHFDCAFIYGNEKEIGAVFKEVFSDPASGIKRSEVFVTSKLWCTYHGRENVKKNLLITLADLNLEYLDLYLVHWPISMQFGGPNIPLNPDGTRIITQVPLADTWAGMQDVHAEGLARAIGVSNCTVSRLESLLPNVTVVPAVNQVELHPYLIQPRLFDYCTSKGIHLSAYSVLGTSDSPFRKPGAPSLLTDEKIGQIAARHAKSPAQVILRWSFQRGTSSLPKSVNPERIAQNLNIFDFELSGEEFAAVSGLNQDFRFGVIPWGFDPFAE